MNVEPLPARHCLENIPHMLRRLAQAIEAGEHGEVNALIVVTDNAESGTWPLVFGFGADDACTDYHVIGLLETAKTFLVQHHTERG